MADAAPAPARRAPAPQPGRAVHVWRRLLPPELAFGALELLVVGYPLSESFQLDDVERGLLLRAVPAAVLLGGLVWFLALRAWLGPFFVAARRRARGEVLEPEVRETVREALARFPLRTVAFRAALYGASGLTLTALLHLRTGFPLESVGTATVMCTTHAFGASVFRALWYSKILGGARTQVLPDLDDLQRFALAYKRRIRIAVLATGTVGIAAVAFFAWYFLPLNLEHYLRVETWYPATLLALHVAWSLWARRLDRPIDAYLAAALSPRPADHPLRDDPRALAAVRAGQRAPYALALSRLAFRLVGVALLVVEGALFFSLDVENSALIGGETAMIAVGLALFEALWHRRTMRPLLTHLAARHRPAPDTIKTPLSLRNKMLVGFGVLTVCACGLSLFWSFSQYKTLATTFIQRESELRLDSLVDELRRKAEEAGPEHPLPQAEILAALRRAAVEYTPAAARDHAVLWYLPPGPGAHPIGVVAASTDGGAPPMPWTGEALLRRLDRGRVELSELRLTGAYARLYVAGRDLGAVALCLPGYRGRGPSTAPQIRVLLSFFLILVVAAMGLVIFIATDLAGPIRELERKAAVMAKGDLTRPVVAAAGEGDEVGRLSFAFEEMRRALNDKLRSSTEINLSLEAEVTRRTAELERRNHELKTALEQLQRAQDELVRSEKMASMGRLVAGIAHEINNPVNAVVNTVGPLEQTLDDLTRGQPAPDDVADVREMIRVIQRGARRTKEIVQALHNYSRGDDDRLVDVDLHRSIDDSLDLLRHHLKNGITVERQYGDVARVRGRTSLAQVFMNLITNAAQALAHTASPAHPGVIRIETARGTGPDDGKVRITIADNGPGIPADVLPRIFDPFFTTKDVGEGSGLGLSIVHGIVERHGGSITVTSEVGKGTQFTVWLPVGSELQAAAPAADAARAG